MLCSRGQGGPAVRRRGTSSKKSVKKSAKKFGGNQKVRIFAVPFGNGGARTDGRGLRRGTGDKIIDKADKNKESTTKYREQLTRALIPSRNEQQPDPA